MGTLDFQDFWRDKHAACCYSRTTPHSFHIWSTAVASGACVKLPTPPCKVEKSRFRRRAAARYPCVRASPKIQLDRHHRVSERAAPGRERPTPSRASRSLSFEMFTRGRERPTPSRASRSLSFEMFTRATSKCIYSYLRANIQRQVRKPPLLGGFGG